ncbi:MAG: SDR family oxidoreductase [Myxococcales bacterium]|nr:SDR family oxidoreductase [Myxococcales bacterium]
MANGDLSGRIALVTGAGRGIGRAIALGLAEDGADVAVNFRKDEAAARETVAAIEGLGRKAAAYRAAVDDYEASEAMVRAATSDLGTIDLLVHNAGIASRGQSVAKTDPAELERCVRVHALGPHVLSGLVVPGMREAERGDIVMISSAATEFHAPNGAPYNMGKAAMESLAFTLAKEERRHGIHVNVVAPGLVETEMGRRLMKATAGVDDLRKLDASMPFGRVCQPEDVAAVVRFLVSPGAGYVTGQRLYVHGGGQ